jgi:CPA1 family monovalent cation:H+ antiporter
MLGSVAAGWVLSLGAGFLIEHVEDAPTSVILQFVTTFAVWMVAEHLGLSAVVTIVVFGLTLGRRASRHMRARLRVASFAIWESATVILNILAFTLIGLQIRPIVEALDEAERLHAFAAAGIILVLVMAVRFVWVMTYDTAARWIGRRFRSGDVTTAQPPSTKGTLVVAWSGMRGIVTLAAALALPAIFPQRDFILFTAFVVVLGTLVIQGVTLRPLLALLRLPRDETVDKEIRKAREAAITAAISALEAQNTPAAQRLKAEYEDALSQARRGVDPRDTRDNALRRKALSQSRRTLDELRRSGAIGDEAYRRVEEELDWEEMSTRPAQGAD